jgi:hypothetical protein
MKNIHKICLGHLLFGKMIKKETDFQADYNHTYFMQKNFESL